MKILLTSNASYVPPRGGSTRSNLSFLQTLVKKGHTCRVVSSAPEAATPEQIARLREELEEQQLDGALAARLAAQPITASLADGIEVVAVRDLARHAAILTEQIREFQPDRVIVSSEDLSHTLLREAAKTAVDRLVYLAHTPQWFPFGPASWNPSEEATTAIKNAAGIIVISASMGEYVWQCTGCAAALVHPPLYGEGPWPLLGNFESGYLAMVNPCAAKGLPVFLDLADLLPSHQFAVLPGWGTNQEDYRELRRRSNIAVLPRVKQIEQFLSQCKLLLMPSLWLEGFGLIAMEAMLRGVPVIASDSGGLKEAKARTNYSIPVCLIEHWEAAFDDRNMPRAILPSQNIEPWLMAVKALDEQSVYEAEREHQQHAATRFVDGINPDAFESALIAMTGGNPPAPFAAGNRAANTEHLSDAKKALLLKRLRAAKGIR